MTTHQHQRQQLPLRWLLVASFPSLAAATAIAFITDRFFLTSTAATTIVLAGVGLFFGIGGDHGYCFCDWPLLSVIHGSNYYCFGWWRPFFLALAMALAGDNLVFGIDVGRLESLGKLLLLCLVAASFSTLVVAIAIASITGHLSPLSDINGSNLCSCFG